MNIGDRRIIWHGMFLFLLGLITGLFEQRFKNPRMALSAHLEGIMNGTFLIGLGAVWDHIELRPRTKECTRWIALYGTYANWLFTTYGAAFGTNASNPIVAAGYRGKPWQEAFAKAGFLSVALAILITAVMAVKGLGRKSSTDDESVGEVAAAPSLVSD